MDFSGIEKVIISVKGQNVLIDSDVAKIYGVETREVNKAIKNNPDKFPAGYIVEADKNELIKTFDKFKNIKNYPGTPKAFTEKSLYMLATILKSPQATASSAWAQHPLVNCASTFGSKGVRIFFQGKLAYMVSCTMRRLFIVFLPLVFTP